MVEAGDNDVRLVRGDGRGHVESHFVKATSPDGERAVWIRYTLLVPPKRADLAIAEVWAIAFARSATPAVVAACKASYPLARARLSSRPLSIEVGSASLVEGALHGELRSGSHAISWQLSFDSSGPSFRALPMEVLYSAPFPRTKLVTPHPSVRLRGAVVVDGARWEIEDWAATQGHNWGRSHPFGYAWSHASAWTSVSGATEPIWFEGASARLRIGAAKTPWLSIAAIAFGDEIVRFRGPRALASRTVEVGLYRWRFTLRSGAVQLEAEIAARKDDLAGLAYESPDGSIAHCLATPLARGRLLLVRAERRTVELHSDRVFLELLTRDRRHGVPMLL